MAKESPSEQSYRAKAALRHLLAAERALERVRRSMRLAEDVGVDLSAGALAQEELSLCLQAERFAVEDRVDEDGRS